MSLAGQRAMAWAASWTLSRCGSAYHMVAVTLSRTVRSSVL